MKLNLFLLLFISMTIKAQQLKVVIADKNINPIDFSNESLLQDHEYAYIDGPIKEIPKDLYRLKKLKSLRIQIYSDVFASKIVTDLQKIENLERLEIAGNNYNLNPVGSIEFYCITKIPDEINKLVKLKKLQIVGNLVKTVNIDTKKLVNLETINLFRNKIEKFPIELLKIKKLTVLGLENNYIKTIPKEICNSNIVDLTIGRNLIKEIPECLLGMNLEYLYLNENHISQEKINLYQSLKKERTSLRLEGQYDNK